jgi:TRAP-type uncharacterized transport system fused permease subunit
MNSTKQLFAEHCQKLDFLAGRALIAIIVFGAYNLAFGFFNLPKTEDFEYYLLISSLLVAFGVMVKSLIDNDVISGAVSSNVAIIDGGDFVFYAPFLLGGTIFIISQQLNLPLLQIAKHAFLPAIIIYSAILFENYYQSKKHFGAIKLAQPFYLKILNALIIASACLILSGAIYFFNNQVVVFYQENATLMFIMLLLVSYIWIIFYQNLRIIETAKYHYYLPILLLFWLNIVENMPPISSLLWALSFLMMIILTADALQSSFEQRKRLKQPKVASELYAGVKKLHNYCIKSVATILFYAYYGIIIWAILQIIAALNIDWAMQPELVKWLIAGLLLVIIPSHTPLFWRYFLLVKLVDIFIINQSIAPLLLYLLLFYIVVAIFILQKYWQQKQWRSEYWLMLFMPILILLNNDLILLEDVGFEYFLVLTLNVSIAAVCLLSSSRHFLLAPNSNFENAALFFAGIILLLPNSLFGFFAYSSLQELPQNFQLAAKYVVYFPILCMVVIVCWRQRMRS